MLSQEIVASSVVEVVRARASYRRGSASAADFASEVNSRHLAYLIARDRRAGRSVTSCTNDVK